MTSPLLAVVVAASGRTVDELERTLLSLSPVAENWLLSVVVFGEDELAVRSTLRAHPTSMVFTHDPSQPCAVAWNDALKATSASRFMVVDAGTEFLDGALVSLLRLCSEAECVFGYTDHAVRGTDGTVAVYKPAWSPDRLRVHDYIGPAIVFSTEALISIGGFREDLDAAQRFDAALRLGELQRDIAHLAHVTIVTAVPDMTVAEQCDVVNDHLTRMALPIEASVGGDAFPLCLTPAFVEEPMVTIVVPTAGARKQIDGVDRELVTDAIRSVLERTAYSNYELLAVLDRSSPEDLGERLIACDPKRVRVAQQDRPFHFSAACNLGAAHAAGDVVVFLNDDTEVADADWLGHLVMHLQDFGVGAVGLKMLFEDGSVQHAGLLGRHLTVRHRYVGQPVEAGGYLHYLQSVVNVAAVTGACLAVRMDAFWEVGGFSLKFPLNYNDVDLCMKLRYHGLRVAVDNQVTLRHFESATRTPAMHEWEEAMARDRWEPWLRFDPYDNPSFDLDGFADDPLPLARHVDALANGMEQPVRVLPGSVHSR